MRGAAGFRRDIGLLSSMEELQILALRIIEASMKEEQE